MSVVSHTLRGAPRWLKDILEPRKRGHHRPKGGRYSAEMRDCCIQFDHDFKAAQEQGDVPASVDVGWVDMLTLQSDEAMRGRTPTWLAQLNNSVPHSEFKNYNEEEIEYTDRLEAAFRTGQSEGCIPKQSNQSNQSKRPLRRASSPHISMTMTPAGWQQWINQNMKPCDVPRLPLMWLRKEKWACCEPARTTDVDGQPVPWELTVDDSHVFTAQLPDLTLISKISSG